MKLPKGSHLWVNYYPTADRNFGNWTKAEQLLSLREELLQHGRDKVLVVAMVSVEIGNIALSFIRENFSIGVNTAIVFLHVRNSISTTTRGSPYWLLSKFRNQVDADWHGPCVIVDMAGGHASADIGKAICRVADELQAQALILSSRRFGAMKSLMLGSVSHYCSTHASCPVAITRDNES